MRKSVKKDILKKKWKKISPFIKTTVATLTAIYVNYKFSPIVHAQITDPVDSLYFEFGKLSAGYESRHMSTSIWEIKEGVPQIRDTINYDTLYLSKNKSELPKAIYEGKPSFEGTGVEKDTIQILGIIADFETKLSIPESGANIFAYVLEDELFMGQNYVEPGPIIADENGRFSKRIVVPHIKLNPSDVKTESIDDKIPDNFELYQNYPNPFNPRTTIRYDLDKPAKDVELAIYNQLGEQILKKEMPTGAGSYNVHWDGESESGQTLPSGVYFYNLKVDDKRKTKSMVLLK